MSPIYKVYKHMFHVILDCIFGLQVLHNFLSEDDGYTAKNDTSLLSIPETVKLNARDDIKDLGKRCFFITTTHCTGKEA